MAGLINPLRRGDVVIAAAGGGFGGKPRPALVIRSDKFAHLETVILALFTSELTGVELRPRFEPTDTNGLFEPSDLMVDVLVTVRQTKIGSVIGRLGPEEMTRAQRALLVILGAA